MNYKHISKHPDKYPKLYPLLQTFLSNNKQNINRIFQESFTTMKQQISSAEQKFTEDIYNSPAMQSWLTKNPEKHRRIAWNQFNEITSNKIAERIDQ